MKATADLTIYETLSLSPAAKKVEAGTSAADVTFTAVGGVPDPKYDFYLDGILKDTALCWFHKFDTPGDYTVQAVDSLGNRAIATISVYTGGTLAIDAPQNWVEQGNPINLTATNSTGDHEFYIVASNGVTGSISNPTAAVATYNAPTTETIVTIQLHDNIGGDTVKFDIHVLDSANAPPPALTFPSTRTIEEGDDTILAASGGVNGYTFWLDGSGSLNQTSLPDRKIRYQAPGFPTTAYVYVEDGLGRQQVAAITVEDD
jgi:hypothetical protein